MSELLLVSHEGLVSSIDLVAPEDEKAASETL
jgi:hypothetical protein